MEEKKMEVKRGTKVEHKVLGVGVVWEEVWQDKVKIKFGEGFKLMHMPTVQEYCTIIGMEELPKEKTAHEELMDKTKTSRKKRKPK